MQVGLVSPGGAPLNVRATVAQLMEDMRSAALRKDMATYESRSDELSQLVMAQITPEVPQNWRKYQLTGAETIVADMLLAKRGKVVTAAALMDGLYFNRPNSEPDQKIITIYICKIRKKLPADLFPIQTIWGVGFQLLAEGQVATKYGTGRQRITA